MLLEPFRDMYWMEKSSSPMWYLGCSRSFILSNSFAHADPILLSFVKPDIPEQVGDNGYG
ncbi:hypothetical protein J31TS3_49370 [Paenibacillus lactis]|nr:hypothetical protein J31TS3_49370 [Paenibacillus lactis]